MTAQRCVVTGAGGFIGYQLANALAARGESVTGVDLHYPPDDGLLGPPLFRARVADIRDEAAMAAAFQGAACVYHLASLHLQQGAAADAYRDVNVRCLPGLLTLARAAGVRRWIHASTVGIYGDVPGIADENTAPRPQSIYGETKLAGERIVMEIAAAGDIEAVVLRPAWVYGAGCPRTMKLARALRRRRFMMIGAGRNLRHPIYIDDAIDAFRLAAVVPGAAGQTMIVAGERAVTTRELVEAFCLTFGYPAPRIRIPYLVGVATAIAAERTCAVVGLEPPISRRSLEFFGTNNAFSIARARAVLGFAPRFSLEAGLAATMQRLDAGAHTGRPNHVRNRGLHLA